MQLSASAHGPLPAEQVWLRFVEPARWPSWAPQIRRVRASTERLATGTTGQVIGPCSIGVPFLVTAVDEEHREWSWRVSLGPVRFAMEHEVTRAGAGTRASVRMHAPLALVPLVLGYLPLARFALHRLVHP